MSNPTYVTNQNINFNGILTPVVVLDNTNNIRTVVEWDTLPTPDQQLLQDLITQYGGVAPLAGPVAGFQGINVVASALPTTPTGVISTPVATPGMCTIDLGAGRLSTDLSGLSSSLGTSGYGVVNYSPSVSGASMLGLPIPTQGSQTIGFAGVAVGANPTGLANTTAAYTTSITIDGNATPISIVGNTAQTFTTLIAQLNTALGSAASAALVAGNIVVTSATFGPSSTILSMTGTLLPAITGFAVISAAVNGTGVTTYTLTATIDGIDYPVAVSPSTTNTFTQLVAAINSAIGAFGTAAIVGGDLRITSASHGVTSKVHIAPGTLLPSTVGYVDIFPPANGSGTARTYSATVVIDGTNIKTVSFKGTAGTTLADVINDINFNLGTAATASLTNGHIQISSSTTGPTSKVQVLDSGFLFASLVGFASITSVSGVAPTVYTATVTLTNDGVVLVVPVSIAGFSIPTLADVIAQLTTIGGSNFSTVLTGHSSITLTNTIVSVASSVSINGGTLLHAINPVIGLSPANPSVSSLLQVVKNTKTPNGASFYSALPIKVVGNKPAVPPYVKHTTQFIYFNGTHFAYLDDDTLV